MKEALKYIKMGFCLYIGVVIAEQLDMYYSDKIIDKVSSFFKTKEEK